MQSAIWSILIPILVGLIAGLFLAIILFGIKPKIKISCKICQSAEDRKAFTIKVINLTRSRVTDVAASLSMCIRKPDGAIESTVVGDTLPGIHYIKGFSKHHKEYAIQPTYHLTMQQLESLMSGESYLSYTFECKHIFTKAPTYSTAKYTAEDVVLGMFESGKSEDFISL